MASWTTRPIWTILLMALLLMIALIQVLPQVDLPVTAFHEDTAPVVVKFRATSAPALLVVVVSLGLAALYEAFEPFSTNRAKPAIGTANFVPILNCSLLC